MLTVREHDAIVRTVDVDAQPIEDFASSLRLAACRIKRRLRCFLTAAPESPESPASGLVVTKEARMTRIHAAMLVSLGLFLCFMAPSRAEGLPDRPEGSAPGAVPLGTEAYSPSLFQFVTTIPDDGKGAGGGWQVATARLNFVDARQLLMPKTWSCIVEVGMPLRTAADGRISARYAAQVTADIATEASPRVMLLKPQWMQADFCDQFGEEMLRLFRKRYRTLGARATGQ
jgi:hypothetical protein